MSDVPESTELIRRARQGNPEALGRLFEAWRGYLRARAERQLSGRVAVRVDASDIVQQTFLEAHQSFDQFLGQDESTLIAWLERILEHTVARTIRDHALIQKRAVRREQSLDEPGGHDTAPRELEAGHTTPSQRAIRGEDVERLTRALEALPEDQRKAVRLRHLEGQSLATIAEKLGRTTAATAGLIKRGMRALREQLRQNE